MDDILEEFEYLIPPKPEGREDPVHVKPQVQLNESEKQILDFMGREDVEQDAESDGVGVVLTTKSTENTAPITPF